MFLSGFMMVFLVAIHYSQRDGKSPPVTKIIYPWLAESILGFQVPLVWLGFGPAIRFQIAGITRELLLQQFPLHYDGVEVDL